MYKTILFDFDGTLFDTGEGIIKSIRHAVRAFGYDDTADFRSFIGPPLWQSFIEKYGLDDAGADALVEKFRERYNVKGVLECYPYPGIIELVRELRERGCIVAVATGKPTASARMILDNHGLDDLFHEVVGMAADNSLSKKWEVISVVLEKYGRENAIMVGDRDNDVKGAAACSLPCIGVAWGYAAPGELEKAGAACVVTDAAELRKKLILE